MCRFTHALADHESRLGQQLHALKTSNARKDDDMGRLIDGITSQMAAAKEGIKAKLEFIRSSQVTMERLRAEVRTLLNGILDHTLPRACQHVNKKQGQLQKQKYALLSSSNIKSYIRGVDPSASLPECGIADWGCMTWGHCADVQLRSEQGNAGGSEGEGTPGRCPGQSQAAGLGEGAH